MADNKEDFDVNIPEKQSVEDVVETSYAKKKQEAVVLLTKVVAMLDKLAKRSVIHKNKASNLKSKLTRFVSKLA